ncbi:HlyD family efflux transporter periplasmic adaptor subunit [Synechococcus sp. PCC 6312]|uniref:HlyD family efflux transporter periplasmic adaptor subunit n=1 Tax=Synechococcus sp. (strain ATCC 27167 / PCC 6312) TaxID=195253 RepID=UPI00029F4185|nr:HlyD family efflux transporter periplasmic adaptor subunit [Synechococcus sp. PCC 6312]AFY60653.1 multidrug resistance efflux pump [Synechococcus sp. PCC 6312]
MTDLPSLPPSPKSNPPLSPTFDRPVILQQAPTWSRAIVWGIVGVSGSLLLWASFFQIEEAVPAMGQLEPEGVVKDISSPSSGILSNIYVRNGQQVTAGEPLFQLDPATSESELAAQLSLRQALQQENQFYQQQLTGSNTQAPATIPATMRLLAQNRQALLAENQLFRSQLVGNTQGVTLTDEQRLRWDSNQEEARSRIATVRLQIDQLQKQLTQAQGQLKSQQQILKVNQDILADLEPVAKEGAIARVQYLRQVQEVQRGLAEVDRFQQDVNRLQVAIAEAKEKLKNTTVTVTRDLYGAISENDKRIAEIDTQFSRTIVENNKKLAEILAKVKQLQTGLNYQTVRAPVTGTVFDLQAHSPGFVVTPDKPMLKVVPKDALVAEVYITNRDIGFVNSGMRADVRIDSFPFSEFGDIKGELIGIAADALPPTPERNFYSFPARIKLDQQYLKINDKQIPLQSGMAVSANIKIRKRTVMSLITDLFTREVESLNHLR